MTAAVATVADLAPEQCDTAAAPTPAILELSVPGIHCAGCISKPQHVASGEYPRLLGKQTGELGRVQVGIYQ